MNKQTEEKEQIKANTMIAQRWPGDAEKEYLHGKVEPYAWHWKYTGKYYDAIRNGAVLV